MNGRNQHWPQGPVENCIVLRDTSLAQLTEAELAQYSAVPFFDAREAGRIRAEMLETDTGRFSIPANSLTFPAVSVVQQYGQVMLCCGCPGNAPKLCEHQSQVLYAILSREEFRIYFDSSLRHGKLQQIAVDYGLEEHPNLDELFLVAHDEGRNTIRPRQEALVAVTPENIAALSALLLPVPATPLSATRGDDRQSLFLVIRSHKYYRNLVLELYTARTTKEGKLKNPLTLVNPMERIWETQDVEVIRFYTAVAKFQHSISTQKTDLDIVSLKSVVNNPLQLPFYYHNATASESVVANALVQVRPGLVRSNVAYSIGRKGNFYELRASLTLGKNTFSVGELELLFGFFILQGGILYLAKDVQMLQAIAFFKGRPSPLLIHERRYAEFKSSFLEKLENKSAISYNYVQQANAAVVKAGNSAVPEKLLYLVESGNHILLVPTMKYGGLEIPVRSKRQIFALDARGQEYLLPRNEAEEVQFISLLVQQHPHFAEQLDNDLQDFYLHKERFLNEDWFLQAFDEWRNHGIEILGFNEISGNKLSPHKARVNIRVITGLNWFNTLVDVRFGKKKASLKHIQKAIRNKSRFVTLDDGTQGILPAEWLDKFSRYFTAGDVFDEQSLHTPLISYAEIAAIYEQEMLDAEVVAALSIYQEKLRDFEAIKEIPVPETLQAELRGYQKQGLNWLNFLDDFNFGGCLADDMGLGKTIQIIAFILTQREKTKHNTNLLVVPNSLLFNWQEEVAKFAPDVKVHLLHGIDRQRSTRHFDDYEIILTSYGTLLSDIGYLRRYEFNYVFLDESQNIKNPESQRYKAACQLVARNRIVITGTPVENNTFDLYGQFSFACPGLLGSKQYFRDSYAIPIDRFKSDKRAAELHEKVRPFLLRRTKQQVATELPDKTEMVLYCEMEERQRKVYDAYEKEFREQISATSTDELPKHPMNVLKGLTRLRQICNSPALLKDERFPDKSSAKITVLMEEIEQKAPNHKILVFSQFVSMLELIKEGLDERGIAHSWLTGATKNRMEAVNRFQQQEEVRVFLISLKAGGTGLNLTAADYVYIVDPWWNPAAENQAIDRSYRIGQQKNVIAIRLICPDTVEDKILKLQGAKTALADGLVKQDVSLLKALDKETLMSVLGA